MKKYIRYLLSLLSIVMIGLLFGCSKAENNSEINGGADEKIAVIVSDNSVNTQTTAQATEESTQFEKTTTAPIINISEEQARNIAYKRLREEYSAEAAKSLGIDYTAFEFSRIELFNYGEGGYYDTFDKVKEKGHSYYDVTYRNTTQLCDIAYFLIDASDGEILLSAYMGD